MNDASTTIGQPAAVNPPGKLAYATPTTAPLVAGRRSFFKYRDLGVTAASSGKIRAQVTIGADGMTQPTGWHYHVCEGQFVYMLSGWVDLEFEDGQKLRIQSGESLYIPGGLRHNETAASKDLELLEISVPADMGTVACDPPEGGPSARDAALTAFCRREERSLTRGDAAQSASMGPRPGWCEPGAGRAVRPGGQPSQGGQSECASPTSFDRSFDRDARVGQPRRSR